MSTKTFYDNEKAYSLDGLNFVTTKSQGNDYIMQSETLLNEIEKRLAYKQFLRDVGEELKFVLHNKHRDSPKFSDDMFEWVLGNGQEAYSEQYPDYCKKFNITTEKFNFPDLRDGYIVSNPTGSGNPNGLYILDSIKAHNHSTPNHSHITYGVVGDVRAQLGDNNLNSSGIFRDATGIISLTGDYGKTNVGHNNLTQNNNASSGRNYRMKIQIPDKTTSVSGAGNTGNFGAEQTAGRRTTAQIYIKAKFLI